MGITPYTPHLMYDIVFNMKEKEPLKQVRIYQKEHGVLRKLSFRKGLTIAEIIREIVKLA